MGVKEQKEQERFEADRRRAEEMAQRITAERRQDERDREEN
jgi:hypothetical protein